MKHNSLAILIPDVSVKAGSLANYAAALAHGLHQLGLKKMYIVYLFSSDAPPVALPENVELICLNVKRSRSSPFALARFLKKYKPDVLISISAFINFPAVIGWLVAGKSSRLIVSQHSTMSYRAYVEYKHDFWMRNYPKFARLLYPLASGLHANSQDVLDDLLYTIRVPVNKERAFATPNPINIEHIQKLSQAEPEHPWLKHKEKPVIISAGRLAQQKNYSLLLEAFALVRQKLDARLIILGEDGPDRQNLDRLIDKLGIEKEVSLPGFSSNPWSSFAKADAFVLSSQEEPFGLVIVEAMACGIPVVATDAIGGGPKTILEAGKNGILVPQGDVEALSKNILDVILNQDLHHKLVVAGEKRCTAFTPKVIAEQWVSFLEKIA
ncbi:MAG: glycosyltransferase [Calothrix sp. C42_A2020_038]|nr:glycosyltransferase [Calothrix sp. C42_A2020_038]